MSQVKEMTARFMLVSLLLGAIMAGLMLLLDWIMVTLSYEWASVSLGAFAVALVVIMAFAMGRKYEPVGE
jgi:thiamine transporter ThiT